MDDNNKEDNNLNIFGEFSCRESEQKFRKATWARITDRIGKTSLLAGLFFLMAGAAPFFVSQVNDIAPGLLFYRALIALWGFFIYFSASSEKLGKYILFSIAVFILMMGLYESYEAVISYRPDFEYNIPFTLLIILLMYLLFPLSVKSVAPASIISSVSYIMALHLFTPAEWTDLIQLSVFFIFVNIMGLYMFIELSRNRRYRYLSYNEINKLYFLLNEEIRKKDEANKKLSYLAETDELTGIANRRKFFSILQSEFSKSVRYRRPLSIIMLDIDHFKKVNDCYGHDAGDKVIREFIRLCRRKLRQSDIIARIGGEEFAVILPETSEEGAYILAERIRGGIENKKINIGSCSLSITSSCGIVSLESGPVKNINDFIKKADNALYMAKNSGRNMSCLYKRETTGEYS